MKKLLVLCVCVGFLVICGCGANTSAEKEVKSKIESCRLLLLRGDLDLYSERSLRLREVRAFILAISNRESRVSFAHDFAKMVNGIQLTVNSDDFAGFQQDVAKYKDCFDVARWILSDVGIDDREYMEYFFSGMGKLRKACFSISQAGRGLDEGEQSFMKRCRAVWTLMEDYAAEVSLWHGLIEPRLKKMPENLQREYRDRWMPFLQYSHGRELRESMLFGHVGKSGN